MFNVTTARDPNNSRVWNVYVDGDLHTYGYCDRRAAMQAAAVVRVELDYEFRATQQMVNLVMRSN